MQGGYKVTVILKNIFSVRARMVDGVTIELLLFADEQEARDYAKRLDLPYGFDSVCVVPRRVIGDVLDRRSGPRNPRRRSM